MELHDKQGSKTTDVIGVFRMEIFTAGWSSNVQITCSSTLIQPRCFLSVCFSIYKCIRNQIFKRPRKQWLLFKSFLPPPLEVGQKQHLQWQVTQNILKTYNRQGNKILTSGTPELTSNTHRLLKGLATTHTKTTVTVVELQLLNINKQHYQAADVVKE